jgi:hypothetical protein
MTAFLLQISEGKNASLVDFQAQCLASSWKKECLAQSTTSEWTGWNGFVTF